MIHWPDNKYTVSQELIDRLISIKIYDGKAAAAAAGRVLRYYNLPPRKSLNFQQQHSPFAMRVLSTLVIDE